MAVSAKAGGGSCVFGFREVFDLLVMDNRRSSEPDK